MSLDLKSLPEVVQDLERHRESLKIKMLIFCLSKGTWENNPDVLNAFSIRLLLLEIFISIPTLPEFIFKLYQTIKSLKDITCREEYVRLAKYLIEKIKLIFNESERAMEDKYYTVNGIDVSQLNFDNLLIKETEEEEHSGTFINVMEMIVHEKIFRELKKIPVNMVKYMNPAEIAAYALNRLPPLYASSEQGKVYQGQKIDRFQALVHVTVMQGIGAVMRCPLREYTPLNVPAQNLHKETYHRLIKNR